MHLLRDRNTAIMKRFISLFIILALALLALSSCTADTWGEEGPWSFATRNKYPKECFVYEYRWDGTPEALDVKVPNKFNGISVNALGGFYGRGLPMMFAVIIPDEIVDDYAAGVGPDFALARGNVQSSAENIGDGRYETITFKFHLNKSVEKIRPLNDECYYAAMMVDGSTETFLKIEYKYLYD